MSQKHSLLGLKISRCRRDEEDRGPQECTSIASFAEETRVVSCCAGKMLELV